MPIKVQRKKKSKVNMPTIRLTIRLFYIWLADFWLIYVVTKVHNIYYELLGKTSQRKLCKKISK